MNKKKVNVLGIVALVIAALQTAAGAYLLMKVSKYTGFSRSIIISAMAAIAAFILLVDLIAIYAYRFKGRVVPVLAVILSMAMFFVTYKASTYVEKVDESIENLIQVDDTVTETHTMAFVTYDDEDLQTIDDMNSSTMLGYIDNESFIAGNVLALEAVEKNGLTAKLVPYDSYNNLLLALFQGDVDVAAMPNNYYSMFSVNDGYEDYLEKTNIIYTYEKEMTVDNLGGNDIDLTTDPFTVLLMGMDEQRTDTLILASFNPLRMTVTMTSIARDSFVPISCYSGKASDKINAARTVSRQCTIDTVENLMGVDIDFYVEVNFYGVVEMVDAMGGLFLYSPVRFIGQQAGYENDENGRGNFWVDVVAGWAMRDGQQTLALARERHAMPNGDFDRQENQQTIIKAMVTKMLEMRDLNQILAVIQAAGDHVKTNFSLDQMSQIINLGIQTLNTTYEGKVDGVTGLFNVINSRVTGYSSWNYNEQLSIPLWIYRLWNGSIKDNSALINRNIWKDQSLRENYDPDYDTLYPYYSAFVVKEVYNEQRIAYEAPDIMPTMKNVYYLADVNKWISSRSWIKLNVVEVREGDSLYSSSYRHNIVVAQSVAYGKLTEKMSELTVWVIKHDLDCTIEENQIYSECDSDNVLPDFVGMSLSEVNSWTSKHSEIKVNIKTLAQGDEGYDSAYSNAVKSQSVKAYTQLSKVKDTVELVYCDGSTITINLKTLFGYTSKSELESWLKKNWSTNYSVKEAYSDTVEKGKLISITIDGTKYTSATSNPTVKTTKNIVAVVSKGAEPTITVPNFTTVAEYQEFCKNNGIKESITYKDIADDSKAGTEEIASQSVKAGTYKASAVSELSITVNRYVKNELVDVPEFKSVEEYNAFIDKIGGTPSVSYPTEEKTVEDESKAGNTEESIVITQSAKGTMTVAEARKVTLTVKTIKTVYVAPAPTETPDPEDNTGDETGEGGSGGEGDNSGSGSDDSGSGDEGGDTGSEGGN